MPCYKSGELMMMAACYKDGKLMITSLIIIKIRFICFYENDFDGSCVKSHTRSRARSYDLRSCNYGITIAFFFDVSFNKQVIIKKLFITR